MKKAGDLLSSFLDNLDQGTLETARGYSELVSSWKAIAGDKIAAHSRIRDLERSVLLVEADHPGWIQILQTKQKDLLTAVRRRFPDLSIVGISFRLSRRPPDAGVSAAGGSPDRPAKRPKYAAPPDSGGNNNAGPDLSHPGLSDQSLDEKINDEEFKASLKRLEQIIWNKKIP
jgi:hypothetical protein